MKNYHAPADGVQLTAPYAVTPGDGMLVGSLFVVASKTAASGTLTDGVTEGMFYLPTVSAEVASEGSTAFWDAANRRVSVSAGVAIGHFAYAKLSGETSTRVRLQASALAVQTSALVSGGGILLPTGNDDTTLLAEFVNDIAASGFTVSLGAGDFVVTQPMVWRSGKVIDKWGNKGMGLKVYGAGAGGTRLFYSGAAGSPMITVNAPPASNIGLRNYFTDISDMAWLRATSGTTQIAVGATSGAAFYGVPSSAGEVLHTPKFKNLFVDGFDFPFTLSDCTLPEFDTIWLHEFLHGIRCGYNIDIMKVRHSMFGSEQFGVTYRNNAIAIKTGYNDGINIAGNGNVIETDHVWCMKIGKFMEIADSDAAMGIRITATYFEDTRQYFHHVGNTNRESVVTFDKCHFSHTTTNDTNQSDPLQANYMAKIQFDGDPAVSGGKRPVLTIRDTVADTGTIANAWVSFNDRNGFITLDKTNLMPGAFGTVRCIRTGWVSQRSPGVGLPGGGTYHFSDSQQGGLGISNSTVREVNATIGSGATYDLDIVAGDSFVLTLPDGDCTIQTTAYSAAFPIRSISQNTEMKVVLIVPAAVTGTRTITWQTRLKMNAGTLTYSAADVNKRVIIKLEGIANSGNCMQLVSPAPAFVTVP